MVFKRSRTLKGGTKTNRNRSRSRSRSRSSSRSRSMSRPPRHRPLIILSSLSKEKLTNNDLIKMWTTFNDKNHGLIIESNKKYHYMKYTNLKTELLRCHQNDLIIIKHMTLLSKKSVMNAISYIVLY